MSMATHLPTPAAPHDLATEAAVIVALIDAPGETIDAVAAVLSPEHFHSRAFGTLFGAVVGLRADGQPSDIVTLARHLRAVGTLDRVGGAAKLGKLVSDTPAVADVVAHALALRELALRRSVVDEARRIAAEGQQPQESAEAWAQDAAARLARVARTAKRASPWEWVTAAGLDEPLPPIPWVCEDLELAPGPPTMLAGFGYSGKTVAGQALALAVAAGLPAFGVFGVARGRVRHIDYEQGRRLTLDRYQRLGRAMGVRFSELGDALGFTALPADKLDDSRTEAILLRELEGVTLAVVDSYRAGAPGIDENSSEARAPLDMLGRVSEATGCAIVVIHHARKTSEGDNDPRQILRGSSALFDACQSIWTFAARKGEPVCATSVKARLTGRALDPWCMTVEDVARDGVERWGLRVRYEAFEDSQAQARDERQRKLQETALAILTERPCSARRLRAELRDRGAGMRSGAELDLLEDLRAAGKVAAHTDVEGKKVWSAV